MEKSVFTGDGKIVIQIPTSYTISVISIILSIYHYTQGNRTETMNFILILCFAGCFALSNLIAPKESQPETETQTENET